MPRSAYAASGQRAIPPLLPDQSFFCPVLQEEYAVRIARDWNTRDPAAGYVGYVTRFEVRRHFIDRYPIRVVGGRRCREYWIPAANLPAFNQSLVGSIELVALNLDHAPLQPAEAVRGAVCGAILPALDVRLQAGAPGSRRERDPPSERSVEAGHAATGAGPW